MSVHADRTADLTPATVTRAVALGGGLVLTGTYVSVLRDVTSVVGGTPLLFAIVGVALAAATLVAVAVPPRVAGVATVGLLAAGAVVYMQAAPLGWELLGQLEGIAADSWTLLSGTSVLRMQAAGAWALGFAPTPVFLSWYLLVRRRYAPGVAVGGLALLVFVLTADAGSTLTLLGVVAGATTVGAGELDRRGLTLPDAELLVVVLAAMVVVTATVSVVPAGTGAPAVFPGGSDPTVEGSLVSADGRLDVVGSVSLSPEVRFVVESDRPAYWRVGAYDRYTGDGWVRSGESIPYDEDDLGSADSGERIVQRVSVRSDMSVIPAAWRPVELDGDAEDVARISSLGGLQADGTLSDGDEYTVVSSRLSPSEGALRMATDDPPDRIEDRYTQLPDDMPDRLDDFTDRVTDDADGPYETARVIEAWLQSNKNYSLDVDRPDGDVATNFVFEMDAGYCTYFATAMTAMLRTQDVPARMVVGYTTGQQVDGDRYVVRGYNAHAWVEVYFADIGWVRFDPTPASPREEAERDRLQEARRNGNDAADTDESEDGTWTPTPTETPTPANGTTPTATPTPDGDPTETTTVPGLGGAEQVTPEGGTGSDGFEGPSKELLAFGLVVAAGLVAGVRRSHAMRRVRRFAGLYWQRPGGDPVRDVRRATDRLEHVFGRHHRQRHTGESRRAYLTTVAALEDDDRIRQVARLHDRVVYGEVTDPAVVEEAVSLVDAVVREHAPLLSRWQ